MISNQADSVRCSPTQNLWAGSISPQFSMMFLLRVVLRISFPPKFLQTFRASTHVFCSSKYSSSFIPRGKKSLNLCGTMAVHVVKVKLVLLYIFFILIASAKSKHLSILAITSINILFLFDLDVINILLFGFCSHFPKCMMVM